MRKIFLFLWLILAAIGIAVGIRAYRNGDLARDAALSDVHICSAPADFATRVTAVRLSEIERNAAPLYVCGVLEASKPESLAVYVYREPLERPVDYNRPSDTYAPGDFFFPVDPGMVNGVGHYTVKIHDYRDVVGTAEFSIVE